jgi:eukaryotic-like serine/threonine-protein kinase
MRSARTDGCRRREPLGDESSLSRGTRLGRYVIESPVGSGAMGDVYRARDTRLGRDVAVKVLQPAFAADPRRVLRFEREVKAVSAVSDPHVVGILDAGREDGVTYFVSELVDGKTLRDALSARRLPLRKALDVGIQVASGLAAAHARGIVHRDIKPSNILISRSGVARIADFGLAKLRGPVVPDSNLGSTASGGRTLSTGEGAFLGTVGYMAPEQVRGEDADARSDIFAFGCVLYEMVTGHRAFDGNCPVEKLAAILYEDPTGIRLRDPGLPAELDRIVEHCLEKDPDRRFQSALDLVFALESVLHGGPTLTVSTSREASFLPPRLANALGLGLTFLRAILLTIP